MHLEVEATALMKRCGLFIVCTYNIINKEFYCTSYRCRVVATVLGAALQDLVVVARERNFVFKDCAHAYPVDAAIVVSAKFKDKQM